MARKTGRKAKIEALAERAGTPGEQAAAQAALTRIQLPSRSSEGAARERLTDALVRKLPLPAAGNVITWDSDCAGFGCRVTAGGAKSYVFNYRVRGSGQQRRITIGAAGNWTTGSARSEARRLRRLVDAGQDPRGEQEEARDAPTVATLIDRFAAEVLPRKRPNTIRDYRGMLDLHIRPFFGNHTKVADVTFSDIDKLHRDVTATGSTYRANRCVALLSRMFSLAIKWEWCERNPAKGIERNPEQKRRRYLSADELKRLTKAVAETPDQTFKNVIMLLILTGARRSEVLGMRWDGLDLRKGKSTWSKLSSETKQKREHSVPLSEPVRQLLISIKRDGEFVFPSDSEIGHLVEVKKAWAALLVRAKITGLRLHDLRHSFASQLASSGASLALIGSMLGHASPITTSRYSHLFDSVQREAAERVGRIVGNSDDDGGRDE